MQQVLGAEWDWNLVLPGVQSHALHILCVLSSVLKGPVYSCCHNWVGHSGDPAHIRMCLLSKTINLSHY